MGEDGWAELVDDWFDVERVDLRRLELVDDILGRGWNGDDEFCTFTRTGCDIDRTIVQFHQSERQRKSDTGTTRRAIARSVRSVKWIEDIRSSLKDPATPCS
jgi:hypothetical protein